HPGSYSRPPTALRQRRRPPCVLFRLRSRFPAVLHWRCVSVRRVVRHPQITVRAPAAAAPSREPAAAPERAAAPEPRARPAPPARPGRRAWPAVTAAPPARGRRAARSRPPAPPAPRAPPETPAAAEPPAPPVARWR